MKRRYLTPGSRAFVALHVAALLAGCATFEAAAPRYGSIKDDPPVAAAHAAPPMPRPVVKVAGRPQEPDTTMRPATKVAARPIARAEATPEPRSPTPPARAESAPPVRAAEPQKSVSAPVPLPPVSGPLPPARANTAPAPETKAAQSNSASTTAEITETRPAQRPGIIERPGAIERPAPLERPDSAPNGERASSAARRADPPQKPDAAPAPAAKAQPDAPKAQQPAQPPAPGPVASATPPASPATPPKAAPAPKSQAPDSKAQPANNADKNGKASQPADKAAKQPPPVPLGPGDGSVAAMVERSELLLRIGNVTDAREVLMPGVTAGNVNAIVALAKTYDPLELRAFLVPPGTSDATKAAELYTEAARLGSLEARQKLERLKGAPPAQKK